MLFYFDRVDVNFVVDEQMQPFVQSEEMKNINDIQILKIETTVCDMKSVLVELVVIVKSGITNSSIPKVMEKCEPLQMSKQQEVGHGHCKCKAGIVAPGVVVESTVVPIVEHVSPILMPKPNVVVGSTVVPTVEHETNTLPPKPNVVVALENMEENRIPLTPSILKLDAHLHEQTKQAKNKMKKRKANQEVPTKTKLHLDESDSSLDTKEDKFDQSLNLLGKLLGLNFESSATAIEAISEDIVVMELFYTPIEFATRFDLCSLQPKTWICGSQHIMNGADHTKLCDEYFGESRYTGKLHACQEDMAHRMAYLFDSSPSLTNDKRRELIGRKLFYVANVKEFELERLKDACLQHKTDSYDCGMFVMKYMQGVVMPTGVHKFDKLERFRLLVDLVNDSSNRIYIEVMNRLEQYKERYSRLRKARRKKKV
ncbi:unnamed protein product [Camellia sinensis]